MGSICFCFAPLSTHIEQNIERCQILNESLQNNPACSIITGRGVFMKKLHSNQLKLLNFLKEFIDNPLTMEELAERLGLASKSVVFHHIKQLESKGYLKRNPSNPADYQILTEPENLFSYINLYGMAQCGPKGVFLDSNPIKSVPVATSMLTFPAKDAFLVEAKGDSMEPKIHEKDWIIAQKNSVPPNKSIVVCVNNEEVLVKKLVIQKEEFILESLNSKYSPIIAGTLQIVGIVRGVIKRGKI